MLEFLDSTDPNLWERSVGEKNLAVLERIRDERKSRINQSSLLYIYFKAWNPNRTLARMEPYMRWLYTPGFVIFSIIIFIIAMSILAGDWTRVQKDTEALYSFPARAPTTFGRSGSSCCPSAAIHEFGHGLTCKHYGGDVNQMGFLLIYFTPAFYTDTTDILLFESTAPREYVIFAGIWVELVVCSISTIIWALSVPGSFVNDLAYKVLLLSGITGAMLESQSVDQGGWLLCDFAVPAYRRVARGILRVFAGLGPEVHPAPQIGSAAGEPPKPSRVYGLRNVRDHLQHVAFVHRAFVRHQCFREQDG